MECFCFLYNLTDKQADGFTAWQNRLADSGNASSAYPLKPYNGLTVAFGATFGYKPSAPKDTERTSKIDPKTLTGIFIGYHQLAGGAWSATTTYRP